MKTIKIVH